MEVTPNENEPKTNPQLTGKVFIRSENKCHSKVLTRSSIILSLAH